MNFFTVNSSVVQKNSIVFFIIMIISWALMLILAPFGANGDEADIGAFLPAEILTLLYAAAFFSPFATAIYAWFWVISQRATHPNAIGLLMAILATSLSGLVLVWAFNIP